MIGNKRFQKNTEDFTCAHCEQCVEGDGYTNHCPTCLWSKHVDVYPGDRAHVCGGMMRPVRIEGNAPRFIIVHVCEKCGEERRNKISGSDNMHEIATIAQLYGKQ